MRSSSFEDMKGWENGVGKFRLHLNPSETWDTGPFSQLLNSGTSEVLEGPALSVFSVVLSKPKLQSRSAI